MCHYFLVCYILTSDTMVYGLNVNVNTKQYISQSVRINIHVKARYIFDQCLAIPTDFHHTF